MKCGVNRIVAPAGHATAVILDSGEEITADHIISSIGAPETERLLERGRQPPEVIVPPNVGRLSFVETITVLDCQPAELGWGADTIVFFNDSPRFDYARPDAPVDPRSGVICIPNNFEDGAGRQARNHEVDRAGDGFHAWIGRESGDCGGAWVQRVDGAGKPERLE